MLLRLLDVLGQLFVLAFIIWTLAEVPKYIRLLFYCIRRHDTQNAIANAIVLLLVFSCQFDLSQDADLKNKQVFIYC